MMRKTSLMILVGVTLLTMSNKLVAQDSDKVVILSPRVGPIINLWEREQFRLFQQIRDFGSAVFFRTSQAAYYARIVLMGESREVRDTTIQYSEVALLGLAVRINHFEEMETGRYRMGPELPHLEVVEDQNASQRQLLMHTDSPPCMDEIASNVQAGDSITIVLRDGSTIGGRLESLDLEESRLGMAFSDTTHKMVHSYQFSDIAKIEYLKLGRVTLRSMAQSLVGGAVIGALGGLAYAGGSRGDGWIEIKPGGIVLIGVGVGAAVGLAIGPVVSMLTPSPHTVECK